MFDSKEKETTHLDVPSVVLGCARSPASKNFATADFVPVNIMCVHARVVTDVE